MGKILIYALIACVGLVILAAAFWFTNPLGLRDKALANQIVKMRVAPKRLGNPKNPSDYGMSYRDVDIVTQDNVRLSAWEIVFRALSAPRALPEPLSTRGTRPLKQKANASPKLVLYSNLKEIQYI